MRCIVLSVLWALSAFAADPFCELGIAHPSSSNPACCAASCGGLCGARGCSANGQASNCCGSAILASDRSCLLNDPPCIRASCAAAGGIPNFNGIVCCATGCGACGGTGCETRPGGASSCCQGGVIAAQAPCAVGDAPCVTALQSPPVRRPVEIGAFPGFTPYPQREALYGFTFDAVLIYQNIGALNYGAVRNLVFGGKKPLLNIEFFPPDPSTFSVLADIAAGQFDRFLIPFAQQVAAGGVPITIRTLHEVNGSWYQWGIFFGGAFQARNTLANHTAAWRRIIQIFINTGARPLVTFQFNLNNRNGLGDTRPLSTFAPFSLLGNNSPMSLDEVGLSVYNFAFITGPGSTRLFDLLKDPYDQVVSFTNKRMFIAEMSSISGTPTGNFVDKAAWVRDAWNSFAVDFPRLQQITWFLINKPQDGRFLDFDMNGPFEIAAFIQGRNNFVALTTPTSATA